MPPTRYVTMADGADIAYRIFDGGPADLILLWSYVSAMEIFYEWPGAVRFYEGLASFSRLVESDPRGTGLSSRSGDPPTLEVRMQDLGAVMDATGLERAALLAVGDGAAVAALFAATYPERVTALVLYAPDLHEASAEHQPSVVPPERRWAAMGREVWGNEEASAEQIEELVGDLGPLAADPAVRRFIARACRYAVCPSDFVALTRVWRETDVWDVLPSIQAPTMVLHRAPSEEEPDRFPAIQRAIPGATRVELPGTEFNPTFGDVDAIVDAVAAHLRLERPAREPDRVLASILFTDIVGSTQLAAEVGDRAWRELLGRHHEVVREQLERFRGIEVDTAGDGFLARFDGPARGVRCAQAIVEGVRPLGLEIRAGLHTGEVEVVGDKLEGIAVHTGARVCSLAGASEVLVSQTVKDLVAGSGLAFEDAGEHELKGVPDRWHLYRVVGS